MFQDSPMTPAEDETDLAWEEYREAQVRFAMPFGTVDPDQAEMRIALQRAAKAEQRFKRLFIALDEPAPPPVERECAQLACEGVLLATALAALVALLLPALEDDFWSIAFGTVVIVAISGWTGNFATRLCLHWAGRL